MNKHAKNIFWVYFFLFLGIPIGYFARILYASNLSVEDYGIFFGFTGFFAFFGFLRNWGIGGASVYFVNKYLAKGETNKVKTLFFFNQGFQFFMSLIIAGLLFFFNDWIFETFYPNEENIRSMFNLYLLIWIANTVFDTSEVFMRIFQNQFASAFIKFIKQGFIYLASWILFQEMVSHIAPLSAHLLVTVFIAIVTLVYLLKKHYTTLIKPKLYLKKDLFVEVIKYSNILVIAGLANTVFRSTDTVMVQYFLGAVDVAFYTTAMSTAMLLTMFITPLGLVLQPLVAKLWHEEKKEQVSQILSLLLNNFLIVVLPLALFFALFAENFILAIYGERFLNSVPLIQVLSLAVVVQGMNQIFSSVVPALGRPKDLRRIVIQVGVFNIIGNLVLINLIGTLGVVITTILSFLCNGFLIIRVVLQEVKINFDLKNNLKIILSALFFIIFAYFLKQVMYYEYTEMKPVNFLLNGSMIFLVSGMFYAVVLLLSGTVNRVTIKELRELIFAKK